MNSKKLAQNIVDTVKEWQIKIGYQNESMRLYYPSASLIELLDLDEDTGLEDLIKKLDKFALEQQSLWGKIQISNEGERVCILVPAKGVTYIHEHVPDSEFLKAFLKEITTPGCTLENIRDVFYSFSQQVKEEDLEQEGLGNVFYFEDDTIDAYVYCLEFDEFGATYHRFSKEDYKKLRKMH